MAGTGGLGRNAVPSALDFIQPTKLGRPARLIQGDHSLRAQRLWPPPILSGQLALS
jgi:hypothetical protein